MAESVFRTESCLKGLTVVIPAYKEEPSFLNKTYLELTSYGAEVIIIDDGATMELSVPNLHHYPNMGYGYSLKRGIKAATNLIVLTMDGDSQHTVSDAMKLYAVFNMIDDCDMLVGSRWNLKEKWFRWLFRKLINFVASLWAHHYLTDLNSGMRVFRRDLAIGYSPILCDTFSFTTSLTMSMVTDGHKVAYFPINVQQRNTGKSRVKLLRDGFVTIFFIFWIGFALNTRRIRNWFRTGSR